jgi:hypothetical protein
MYFVKVKTSEFLKSSRGESLTSTIQRGRNRGWRAQRGQMREGEIAPEVAASGAWQRE